MLLFFIAIYVFVEAMKRLSEPQEVRDILATRFDIEHSTVQIEAAGGACEYRSPEARPL